MINDRRQVSEWPLGRRRAGYQESAGSIRFRIYAEKPIYIDIDGK